MHGCTIGIRLLICLALLLHASTQLAQSLEPLHFNYTTDDGLPSSETYEIIQDRQGYIWISTDNGVCRYDGHQFEHFGVAQGLTDRTILFMHEDHRGWIWMNSMNGNFFIHKGDTIVPFAYNQCIQDVRNKFDFVHDFFVDKQGTLHLSLYGFAIMSITADGQCDIAWQLEVKEHSLYGVYAHDDGHLQLSQTLASLIPRKDFELSINSLNHDNPPEIIPLEINDFERSSAKGFFYVFPLQDQYLFQARSMIGILNDELRRDTSWKFNYGTINCLKELESGQLLLGFFEKKGLQLYESIEAFRLGKSPQILFEDHTISHIAEDRSGGVWVGSIERGVYYIPSLDKQVLDLNLGTDVITALAQTDNYHPLLYLGSEKGRLFQLDATEVVEQPHVDRSFGLVKLRYLKEQDVLFCANPMSIFDGSTWKLVVDLQFGDGVLEPRVLNKLVHTVEDSPLMGFNRGGRFFNIHTNGEQPEMELAFLLKRNLFITAALEEKRNLYWIGTRSGIYQIKVDEKSPLQVQDSLMQGVPINTLLPLPNRSFLIGAKDKGLWQVKRTTTNQRKLTQVLADQSITSLHQAPDGSIWAASTAGVHKFMYQDSMIFLGTLSTLNGLPTNEIHDLEFVTDKVWVASKQGVTSHPFHFEQNSSETRVHLIGTSIDGTSVRPGETLQLAHNSQCRIRFSAFAFTSDRKTRYRYRLGANDRWIETIEPEINFSNLSADDYLLELQALNPDHSWSNSTALNISVVPPFWQRGWFFLLCLSCGLLILYALFRRRIRYLSREKERLALKEEVDQLKQQAYRAQMNPHFIFNCLSTIQGMIMGDAADKDAAIRLLASFSQLIRYALDASRQEVINLGSELDLLERYLILEQQRFSNNFSFSIQLDSHIDPDWIQIPPMLIQPYVENAVLHGMASKKKDGHIQLHYLLDEDYLKVTIQDNGPGIFKHQAEQRKHKGKYRHKSVGMMITKKRIEMLSQGKYAPKIEELMDTQGNIVGTRIIILIPTHSA